MEFFDQYMNEIAIGGSGSIGAMIIWLFKLFSKKLNKMDDRLNNLEKKIEVNTALDRERAKQKP